MAKTGATKTQTAPAPEKTVRPGNPWANGGSSGPIPVMTEDMTFTAVGTSGLRALGGWIREEFLPQLVGRQAARVYREMTDNDATIGALLFAISQSQRQVEWRVNPPNDTPAAMEMVEFVESLMDDMASPWSQFTDEAQSKLSYGFAPFEMIYKRRLGYKPPMGADGKKPLPRSRFNDGKIGLHKLSLRGQDTVIKWFFDKDGDLRGMTQQPWVGPLIDIPIEKMILLRPKAHKNNPEGRSVLRNCYRSWFFLKRLEEQEAICLERMSGVPEYRVPMELLELANTPNPNNDPAIAAAVAAINQFKRVITNVRVDEQMGLITPSNTFKNPDGTPSNVPQYEFRFATPQTGRIAASFDPSINRYKLDMMTSVLADFLSLGHGQSSRGSQTLGEAKIDLFFQAQEGWAQSDADVLNEHMLPKVWHLNNLDDDLMPRIEPDMPQRVDLDGLSNYVMRLGQVGALRFGDDTTEDYLRDAAGMPELTEDDIASLDVLGDQSDAQNADQLQKRIAGMMARRMIRKGIMSPGSWKKKRKRRAR